MATALELAEAVDGLVGYAQSDLDAIWREITGAAQAREALNDVLPALIETYGSAAGSLAADWYDEVRDQVGLGSRFAAVPADIPDVGAYSLVGWASETAVDDESLRTLIEGGMQRRIANFARQTVMGSAVADPGATGWQRVGNGGCTSGFCDMLIARGAVYTEATADFAAHDHCKCSATPAWQGQPVPVKPYTPTLRDISDAERARLSDWLKLNGYQ